MTSWCRNQETSRRGKTTHKHRVGNELSGLNSRLVCSSGFSLAAFLKLDESTQRFVVASFNRFSLHRPFRFDKRNKHANPRVLALNYVSEVSDLGFL